MITATKNEKPQILHPLQRREFAAEVRSVDEATRSVEFVVATEAGVEMWGEPEHLLMSGVDLARFARNPVVLDSHDMGSVGAIIGRAEARVEKQALVARVFFAQGTARADEAWALASTGFLRAVSIGYRPGTIVRVADKEKWRDPAGKLKVVGPARVLTTWELHEISPVPVGADPDALARGGRRVDKSEGDDTQEEEEETMEDMETDNNSKDIERGPGGPPTSPAPLMRTPVPEETRAAQVEARKRTILAFTPPELRGFADGLFLANPDISEADARTALLAERAKRQAPVGTPEIREGENKPKAPEVTEDLILRAFTR